MAGRHVGSINNTNLQSAGNPAAMAAHRLEFPGSQRDQAYAEARAAKIANPALAVGANPFPTGDGRRTAWQNGWGSSPNSYLPASADVTLNVVQTGSYQDPVTGPRGEAI